ncbi:MAG: SRPBCC family protein [Nitrococcus sp.]|nr:SRPBCC family protein [Nitrococcus sp.]
MGNFNSVVVEAPVNRVWGAMRNFHDMSWAADEVECEPVGAYAGNQIGAKRIINGTFYETLIGLDDQARIMRWRIDLGSDSAVKDNVQEIIGEIRVYPITEDNTTFVLWATSQEPSTGGVAEAGDDAYQAMLAELQRAFI